MFTKHLKRLKRFKFTAKINVLLQLYSEVSLSEKCIYSLYSNLMQFDICAMFLNPFLTFYFKMFISTKAGIGALTTIQPYS